MRSLMGKITLEEHPGKKEEKGKEKQKELMNPLDPLMKSVLSFSTFCPLEGKLQFSDRVAVTWCILKISCGTGIFLRNCINPQTVSQ